VFEFIWHFVFFIKKKRRDGYGMDWVCFLIVFFVVVVGKSSINVNVTLNMNTKTVSNVDARERVGLGTRMSNCSQDHMKMNFMIKPSIFQT
jgi:hypothetical protein